MPGYRCLWQTALYRIPEPAAEFVLGFAPGPNPWCKTGGGFIPGPVITPGVVPVPPEFVAAKVMVALPAVVGVPVIAPVVVFTLKPVGKPLAL